MFSGMISLHKVSQVPSPVMVVAGSASDHDCSCAPLNSCCHTDIMVASNSFTPPTKGVQLLFSGEWPVHYVVITGLLVTQRRVSTNQESSCMKRYLENKYRRMWRKYNAFLASLCLRHRYSHTGMGNLVRHRKWVSVERRKLLFL